MQNVSPFLAAELFNCVSLKKAVSTIFLIPLARSARPSAASGVPKVAHAAAPAWPIIEPATV